MNVPVRRLDLPATIALVALVVLAAIGAALIVAHGGFETSPRHGGPSTRIDAPLGYVPAALMYLVSCLGVAALVRGRTRSAMPLVAALAVHLAAIVALVRLIGAV